MVTLRPTRKLQAALPVTARSAHSDAVLGEWYVNRLVVDRRPLLLLVSSTSLLPILVPARDVRRLPSRLVDIVASRLGRLGVRASIIEAETAAMSPVVVGRTIDRSVVGIMVDFAKGVPYYLDAGRWDYSSLGLVEDRLAETPCHAGTPANRVVFPDRKALELLTARWGI
jgi:Domain of unknown function (DUF6933)